MFAVSHYLSIYGCGWRVKARCPGHKLGHLAPTYAIIRVDLPTQFPSSSLRSDPVHSQSVPSFIQVAGASLKHGCPEHGSVGKYSEMFINFYVDRQIV